MSHSTITKDDSGTPSCNALSIHSLCQPEAVSAALFGLYEKNLIPTNDFERPIG
jgi:hypothetical protein